MVDNKENIEVKRYQNISKTYRGYTLLSPVGGKEVYLIDMDGKVVQTWKFHNEIGNYARLLPNSNLLFAVKISKGPLDDLEGATGKIIEMDWNGKIIWEYEDPYMHHDFYRAPDGKNILLRWVPTPKEFATKIRGGLPGTERAGIIWSDSLREIDSDGKILWEWFAYDHLDPDMDIICPLCYRNDWTHATSLSVNADGDILLSLMKTNNVVVVNKKTSNIDWRWGGFLKLGHPHDALWLDRENVMVLGCGGHIAATDVGESEILWINMRSNSIAWEFKEKNTCDFYSSCKANFQRLANNNTLVSEGDTGRIFEIEDSREIVWEFISPFYNFSSIYGKQNMIFGAYRYGMNYEGLKGNPKIEEVQATLREGQTAQDRFDSKGSLC